MTTRLAKLHVISTTGITMVATASLSLLGFVPAILQTSFFQLHPDEAAEYSIKEPQPAETREGASY